MTPPLPTPPRLPTRQPTGCDTPLRRELTVSDTWTAAVYDSDDYVMPDEHVRGWAAAAAEGKTYWLTDSEPRVIRVVTGGARPEPQSDDPDEQFFRMPNPHPTGDLFVEIGDLEYLEPNEVVTLWERAQAAAAGMNTAGVR